MKSRMRGARRACSPLVALMVLATGCNPDDAERMVRLGRKVTARVETLAADQDGGLNKSWQAICNGWQETTLAGRVTARLRWDKKLADAQIQVSATGNIVELKGSVRDPEQRRRAVELAESTTGADKVTDTLEAATP